MKSGMGIIQGWLRNGSGMVPEWVNYFLCTDFGLQGMVLESLNIFLRMGLKLYVVFKGLN